MTALSITENKLRLCLREGLDIPEWFSFPEMWRSCGAHLWDRKNRGFRSFHGAGVVGARKSTIANSLIAKLVKLGGCPITLLDGDVVQ